MFLHKALISRSVVTLSGGTVIIDTNTGVLTTTGAGTVTVTATEEKLETCDWIL
jgi:hypothetical protein